MTTSEIGFSEAGIADDRAFVSRVAIGTVSIIATIARKIVEELAYMISEDLANGRMERTREDWER